jgi:hypothetical protein
MFPVGQMPVGDVEAVSRRLADWYALAPRPADKCCYTLEKMLTATLDLYQAMAAER